MVCVDRNLVNLQGRRVGCLQGGWAACRDRGWAACREGWMGLVSSVP